MFDAWKLPNGSSKIRLLPGNPTTVLARQQPRRGFVPPGMSAVAWTEFLARHGALEGQYGWKDRRAVEWVDALVDWLHTNLPTKQNGYLLKLVKRSIRVAKRDEQFRKAIETTYALGGQQALVSFVREYDFDGVRPW